VAFQPFPLFAPHRKQLDERIGLPHHNQPHQPNGGGELEKPRDHLWEPLGLTDGAVLGGDGIHGNDGEDKTAYSDAATRRAKRHTS
jgi:hypothetical protein